MADEYLLVIDDSPTVQKVVALALSEAGHRVVGATDGAAAFEQIRDTGSAPALILLDGFIPGRDTVDFCRQLTDAPALASVPVVVMIARGQASDLEQRFAKASNVVDTIAKPFSPEALRAVVARVVRPAAGGATARPAAVGEALSLSAAAADGALAQARTLAAEGVALTGDLATISLSQTFELLAEQRHTGALRVTSSETNARIEIYFQGGRVDFAAAVGVAEEFLIGRFVVETGDVSVEALTRVLEERARAGGTPPLFGADLLARGLVSKEALALAIARQTSELGYETLRWQAGFFQFRPAVELPPAARQAKLQLSVDRLLLEGYRRVDEWRVIEREIADLDEVFVRNDGKIGDLPRGTLTRDELGVLDEIDGRQSVREIVRKLRLGSFDVSKIFFRLRRARLIRPRVPPTAV